MSRRRGIIFMAWGEPYVEQVLKCIEESVLPDYPIFLITDQTTQVAQPLERLTLRRGQFKLHGKVRKVELVNYLPEGFDSLLFLDVDTRVLGDISLGFDKAERFGFAVAQAAHYSMDHFQDFYKIMKSEGVEPRGQLLYNSGVVFFSTAPRILEVWRLSEALARKYVEAPWSDQPYLTLALEMLEVNPYTLSTGYNHRAFGELISGVVRIWHSYKPVPDNVNDLRPVFPRRYEEGRIVPVPVK